jgi:restriction system protein
VARRRSGGVLQAWAEVERQRQLRAAAEQRAWRADREERERAGRAAARAHARGQRDALQAYQQGREADAAARTAELDARVGRLAAILQTVLASPPFRLSQLAREAVIPPFAPGPLGVPIVPPDPRAYQPPAPSGLRGLTPTARREHEQAMAHARAQFERDSAAAAAAEQRRRQQLDAYYGQYQDWAARQRQEAALRNSRLRQIGEQMARGDADAIRECFAAALSASPAWPTDFPRRVHVAWDPAEACLLADWELPGYDVVPALARYRYVRSGDREIQVARPAGERRSLYRQALAQCGLAVVAQVLRADHNCQVDAVIVNGFVACTSPTTGQRTTAFVLAATVTRQALSQIDMGRADPVACLEGLGGQLSLRPDKPVPVRPARLAAHAPSPWPGDAAADGGDAEANLVQMDPLDFEDLVAALFQAMGFEVMTTTRSGDGGVDVRAMDPDPIRGGKLVIQVKRYRHTLPRPVRHHAPRGRHPRHPGHHR